MKGGRDGQLVVAIGAVVDEDASEVPDAIAVTPIAAIALVIASSVIAVRIEDSSTQVVPIE